MIRCSIDRNNAIRLTTGGHYGVDSVAMTPAEARAIAAELLRTADVIDARPVCPTCLGRGRQFPATGLICQTCAGTGKARA